ncbi:hypothetical protein GCM10023085_69060 [Actinomadura viridis]|uniref:Uncharacterized protein n=1 Tax=Actinomadura viridis TaxID=58110 RepID=A0A931GQE8_9ACTN|nr:hypothetical protein [Actinomadura viridis]MBG6088444.1 hypothetical protein [Actinomadura viridis]
MNIGGLDISYGDVLLFALGVFLLMGVISFIRQGLKMAAVVVFVLMALAFTAGALRL